ncbi:MAG: hypothetical protein AAF990_22620, partial [Bacteroidota bacterium]
MKFDQYKWTVFVLTLTLFLSACGDEQSNSEQTPAATAVTQPTRQLLNNLTEKIASSPDDASLYVQRAEVYYEEEGYDEAIEDLNKALSLDSTNTVYLHLLADVYLDY